MKPFFLLMLTASLLGCVPCASFFKSAEPNLRERSRCLQLNHDEIDARFDQTEYTSPSTRLACNVFLPAKASIEVQEGNISVGIARKANSASLLLDLPESEGRLALVVKQGKNMKGLSLFSFRGIDGFYHVSTLSKRCAALSAGLVSYQEKLDGGEETVDCACPLAANRVIASGKVYGDFDWWDREGNAYPLAGAKVRLTFGASWGSVETTTDENGHYNLPFNNIWTASSFSADIHVYFENSWVKVIDSAENLYEFVDVLSGMANGSMFLYSHTFKPNLVDGLAEAASFFSAGKCFSDVAQSYLSDGTIPQCKIKYPAPEEDGAAYWGGSDTIKFSPEDPKKLSKGNPTQYEAWDVIGHEYAHHLQWHFFFHDYSGHHYSQTNNLKAYWTNVKNEYMDPLPDEAAIKKWAMGLAWKEGWPTYFSLSAQQSFPYPFSAYPRVGDFVYEAANGVIDDCGNFDRKEGDCDELTIISFLVQLFDESDDEGKDAVSISAKDIFLTMKNYNPEFFGGFLPSLILQTGNKNLKEVFQLYEAFGFSPTEVKIVPGPRLLGPYLTWQAGQKDIDDEEGHHYPVSNDEFELTFLDKDGNHVLSKTGLTSTGYQLSRGEQITLRNLSGGFYIYVTGFDTFGFRSGCYPSSWYHFNFSLG